LSCITLPPLFKELNIHVQLVAEAALGGSAERMSDIQEDVRSQQRVTRVTDAGAVVGP
jgi:hypothetical protein